MKKFLLENGQKRNMDTVELNYENEDTMPILEHLKELRNRLIVSAIALALGFFVALYFYDYIIDFLLNHLCSLALLSHQKYYM